MFSSNNPISVLKNETKINSTVHSLSYYTDINGFFNCQACYRYNLSLYQLPYCISVVRDSIHYLTTKPDGKYGNDTVIAVKRFQENNGLIADGYMGLATTELLM